MRTLPIVTLTFALALGPAALASPAGATHSCMDDVPCYPHVDPDPILCFHKLAQKVLGLVGLC